jgi:hypothetical protein
MTLLTASAVAPLFEVVSGTSNTSRGVVCEFYCLRCIDGAPRRGMSPFIRFGSGINPPNGVAASWQEASSMTPPGGGRTADECGMKFFSETTPTTMRAKAAGNCGSLTVPRCLSPFASTSWISVSIEKRINTLFGNSRLTTRSCRSSQLVTNPMSA